MDDFTRGYIECALWADTVSLSWEDIPLDLMTQSIADCAHFQQENAELLADYYAQVEPYLSQGTPQDYAGHDFYLTRQGHGAGFWDRGLGELGIKLTDAAHSYGSIDDFTMLNEDQSND